MIWLNNRRDARPCVSTSLSIWIITIITLIISTLVKTYIYDKWWFVAMLFVFAATTFYSIFKTKLWKRPLVFAMHLSLIVILLGGFLSYTTSRNGSVHVTTDTPAVTYSQDENQMNFPFNVNLKKFDIVYYPGTMSHADYVANIMLTDANGNILKEGTISMNNILKYNNFRFFNEDFDEDLNGCTLMVQHDPYGIAVTYCGYLILSISMLLMFIKRITGKPVSKPARSLVILLIMMMIGSVASAKELRTLPKDVASDFGDIYIYYGGRISPLQTFAKDFTMKLYGKPNYKGFTSEQVLSGWMFYYDDWKDERVEKPSAHSKNKNAKTEEINNLILSLRSGKLTKIYPCPKGDGTVKWFCSSDELPKNLNDDEWVFIRQSWGYLNELVMKKDFNTLSTTLLKIKTYQKKNAIAADGTTSLPSDFRFKTEKIYNSWSKYNYVAYLSLFFGLVFFVVYCVFAAVAKPMPKFVANISVSISWLIFTFLTFLIILRWIVAGHIPLANSAETQHFMAWVSLLIAGIVAFRNNDKVNAIATGLIVCGLMMLVSVMSSANPKITPLVPVLSSPLLGLHVAVIMVAYALLAFMFINGLAAVVIRVFNKKTQLEIERMADVSRSMLFPAVMCLALGIMIGAVWANISWGTYWGWDPKETWSLITTMIYAIALHKDMAPALQKPMNFHIFNILAFLSVLMTYFGVNYILGGMHSYAG